MNTTQAQHSDFRVIPAVDIKDGRAVRLLQGRADQQTIYDEDPVHAAKRWADAGAKRIHIVDLDGAFEGKPRNAAITLAILKAFAAKHEIEIGGGMRTAESIQTFLQAGAARVVVGTKALEDISFLAGLTERFPGRINLGLDAKGGRIVTKGWVHVSEVLATDLVERFSDMAVGEVIYTDIETDGMLQGPNFKQLEQMLKASPFPLIASGGVTTAENIRDCKKMGCYGAIVGKALYDGRMDVAEALKAGTV